MNVLPRRSPRATPHSTAKRFAARALLVLSLALPTQARAQSDSLSIVIPVSLALPNYNRVGIGQRESLEGGAYVARTDDGGACWYNPAGLALPENSVLNASSNAYEWTTFTLEGRDAKATSGSFGTNASLVAGVLGNPIIGSRNWRLGFASVRPVDWKPGTADFALASEPPDAPERLSFVGTADFGQLVPTAGAGFIVSPNLRVGVALAGWWTTVSQSQVTQDVITDPAQVSALSRSYAVQGSVAHAAITGGVQWDLSPQWALGATIRSPGVRVFGSALVRYDAQLAIGPNQGVLSFRDEEAKLEYKIPAHASLGLSHKFDRGAIEVDVRWDGSTSAYSMISSDLDGNVVVDSTTGPPVEHSVRFSDIRNQAASVIGFAAGGNYEMSRLMVIHFGFYSDPSPVEDPEQSYFRKIDITGLTTGLELRGAKLSGSFGVGYNWGESDAVSSQGLLGGRVASPSLKIHSLSLNYAASFHF